MPALVRVIRNSSVLSLREYFTQCATDTPVAVNWQTTEPEVVRSLLQAVDKMSDLDIARIVNDLERVDKMADEGGQTAIFNVVEDRSELEAQRSAYDRAMWLFRKSPVRFRHAEEVRFTDEHRRTRMYDGFVGMPNVVLRRDTASIEAFKSSVRARFTSANVHVDIFDRTRPMFDGGDAELVQIAVYREGLPNDFLEFENGDLVLRARRPVFEAALTYEPKAGVIEVVGRDRESRQDMAGFLARHLLGIDFQQERLPFRQYDLSRLLTRHQFPTDPADGIESVKVSQLRLKPIDSDAERVTLECLRGSDRTIWDMAQERFGGADPLLGGWIATQTKLTIRFRPSGEARRGRTLPLTVTMPHGCNLKDQTEREQMIGEKYLRRWGILRDA